MFLTVIHSPPLLPDKTSLAVNDLQILYIGILQIRENVTLVLNIFLCTIPENIIF